MLSGGAVTAVGEVVFYHGVKRKRAMVGVGIVTFVYPYQWFYFCITLEQVTHEMSYRSARVFRKTLAAKCEQAGIFLSYTNILSVNCAI